MAIMRLRHLGACLTIVAALSGAPVFAHTVDDSAAHQTSVTVDIGGPFTLVDQHGRAVTERVLLGKLSIVYFGYTNCPDICPVDTQNIAAALDSLKGAPVQAFFVTVDPERDTPARLREWLAQFHPDLIGLSGDDSQIAAVAKVYKVRFKRMEPTSTSGSLLSHPGLIYLMDIDGHFLVALPPGTDSDSIVEAIREYLQENR